MRRAIRTRGFDYFWGFLNGTINYETHVSTGGGGRGTRTTYENRTPVELTGYYPELLTERVVRFVEEHREQPYFLYVAHPLPHTPVQAPARWLKGFDLPPLQAKYAAMLACLDDSVGQMRQALERTGQWERTAVVLLSDNGWVKKATPEVAPAGSNGVLRGGKYELYEGAFACQRLCAGRACRRRGRCAALSGGSPIG